MDFVVEHEGRLRLIEAKWAASVTGGRELLPLLKVRDELGVKAAAEHWIVSRTLRSHLLPGEKSIRVINGCQFTRWFD